MARCRALYFEVPVASGPDGPSFDLPWVPPKLSIPYRNRSTEASRNPVTIANARAARMGAKHTLQPRVGRRLDAKSSEELPHPIGTHPSCRRRGHLPAEPKHGARFCTNVSGPGRPKVEIGRAHV